jgi:hypothetical protein
MGLNEEPKIAMLVCDGRNYNLVMTSAFYGCGYKKIVPYKERFWYEICPKCGGKLVIWTVD